MKTLNKTLSLILALAMVFGLMGVASAAFTDQSKITHTTAVDTCVALNIINGYSDGSYAPAGLVTRAELCKMICIAYNGGVTPTLATTATPTYTDTANNWASAYIEYCTKLGIVSGTGNGMFDPDGTVTGTQAAKMMLVALGYSAKNEGFTGTNWDVAVNVRANEKKLYNELVNFDPGTGLNRDNAAQMIYNMLNATEVEYNYNISTDANGKVITTPVLKDKYVGTSTTKIEFVEDKYDLDKTSDAMLSDVTYNSTKKTYTITLDGDTKEYVSTTDYSKYYGMKVRILYKTDSSTGKNVVYGVVPVDSSVVLSGVVGQLSDATFSSGYTTMKYNGTTYKFDTNAAAVKMYSYLEGDTGSNLLAQMSALNTVKTQYEAAPNTASKQAIAAHMHTLAYTFEMIDNTGDGKIDTMVITPVDVQKITALSSTKVTMNTGSYVIDDDATIYTGAAKNDYAKITPAANTVDGKMKLEKITPFDGTVTETSTLKATIGGITMGDFKAMTAGTAYTGLIQANGFIWNYVSEGATSTAANYAVVMYETDAQGSGTPTATLMFSDGTKKTVDISNDYDRTVVGKLATFTKDSSDVYTLNFTTAKLHGTYDTTSAIDTDTVVSSKVSSNYNVADDAVVFVQVNNSGKYSYKVMTGANFKTVTSTTIHNAYGNKNTSTGYTPYSLIYATIASNVTTGDTLYGYVTANVTSTVLPTDSAVACHKVTFWDGSASKTLYTVDTTDSLAKGDVFQYTLDTNGNMKIGHLSATPSYVTAYADPKISIAGYTPGSTKITSDTTVMYINSSDVVGVAAADAVISHYDSADNVQNVIYIGSSDSAFTLIIYDEANAATTANIY